MKIYCFSGTGHSMQIAQRLSGALGADICNIGEDVCKESSTAVVVFPVYCQNIPSPVRNFLCEIKAENIVLVALYGRKSHGNVIFEASQIVSGKVIAAAYLPSGHTYLGENGETEFPRFDEFVQRIKNPLAIDLPKERKSLWADVFPDWRSQIGVKIKRNDQCTLCGFCDYTCAVGAVHYGKMNSKCIRCLACVKACPCDALDVRYNPILMLYLKNTEHCDTHIYL